MEPLTHDEYAILKDKEQELKILSINNAVRGFGRKFIVEAQKIYARLYGINVCTDCPYAIIEWLKQLYGELLKYERQQPQTDETNTVVISADTVEPEKDELEPPTFVAVTIDDSKEEGKKKVIYNDPPKQPNTNGKPAGNNANAG
ncbi:MAG: hypothetical protein ACTHLE_07230 [Agriterribacter sp.]